MQSGNVSGNINLGSLSNNSSLIDWYLISRSDLTLDVNVVFEIEVNWFSEIEFDEEVTIIGVSNVLLLLFNNGISSSVLSLFSRFSYLWKF